MNICVVGAGHVGLITGACFADLGHQVICVDDNRKKIQALNKGIMPFYEPGAEEVVRRNVERGRLFFTTSTRKGVSQASVVFICVGTPQGPGGVSDLSYVENATRRIAAVMDGYKVIVEKSTVPVKTGVWVTATVKGCSRRNNNCDVVSNPEFLREGKAVYDFMNPDRIVIGTNSERAAKIMLELYKPLKAPVILTTVETAELIKHASNAFLALKVSYINAIGNICEAVGADVTKVAEGMGLDKRIGRDFLDAGVGYGGYCLPKDVAAFINIAKEAGYDFELLKATENVNANQCSQLIKKTRSLLWNLQGKTIGILGLSFKPNTDDIREAPSINVVRQLLQEGVGIKAYDPKAMECFRPLFPQIELCSDPYEAARGSDALVILTEWDEFRKLDLRRVKKLLRQPVIIDGRNVFQPAEMKKLGFNYKGVGR